MTSMTIGRLQKSTRAWIFRDRGKRPIARASIAPAALLKHRGRPSRRAAMTPGGVWFIGSNIAARSTPTQRYPPPTAESRRGVTCGSGQADCMPAWPGIGASRATADMGVPVHFPDRGLAARVLPQDVRAAGADGLPTRPAVGDRPTTDLGGPVHFPDRDLAAHRILPHDVGIPVVVEIARSDRFPARPEIGDRPPADLGVPAHFHDRGLPIRV